MKIIKPKTQARFKYVTLIELLIVMALLSLILSVVMIGITRSVTEQKFRSEVALVIDQLSFAQDLMLILNTDVRVKFKQTENAVEMQLEIERNLPVSIRKEFIEKKQMLQTIRGVTFKDDREESGEKGVIAVKFLSRGMWMSKGLMQLATTDKTNPSEDALITYVCLAGYPNPIINMDDYNKADETLKKLDNQEFEKEVALNTISKLPEIQKKEEENKNNPPKSALETIKS